MGRGTVQISTGFARNRVFSIQDTGHFLAHNFYWLIADYRIEIKFFKTLQQGGSPPPVASFVLGKTHPSVTGASPSFLNKELQAFAQAVPLPGMPFPLSPLSLILWLIENLPGGEEARLSRQCEGLGLIPDSVI